MSFFGDVKNAFSGNNTEDPIAHLGALFSLDPLTRKIIGNKASSAWDDLQTRVPDRVNYNVASVLNGQGAPSISSGFKKDAQSADFASGGGAGQWIKNKPATTLASLITGGEFLGGLLGGGAAGGASSSAPLGNLSSVAPNALTSVPEGFSASSLGPLGDMSAVAPNALTSVPEGFGSSGSTVNPSGWQQYLKYAKTLNQNQSQGSQAQPQQTPASAPYQAPQSWSDKLSSSNAQLALRILANNRGGQPLGTTLSTSVLQQQQAQQQQQDAALQRQLLQAQIAKTQQQKPEDLIGTIPPERYTPASISQFLKSKNYADLVPVQSQINQGGMMAAYDMHVAQAKAAGRQPMGIDEFLKAYTDSTTKLPPTVRDVAGVPTLVAPQRGGGASQTALTNLPTVANNAATVAAAESGGKVSGTTQAEAKIDLPRQEANAAQASKAIDSLLTAPGAPSIFGMQGALPIIPGTERANAKALLEQVQGKTFLEAYNSLKGAGAITETEGKKGEQAIARLGRAQSWPAAKKALEDLKEVIDAGRERARKKAGEDKPTTRVRVDAQGNVVQ